MHKNNEASTNTTKIYRHHSKRKQITHKSEPNIELCPERKGKKIDFTSGKPEGVHKMLQADGREEEVADLDGEAHDPADPQAHHLAGEEEEEDRVPAARERPAPPRRRSTPGRRRGSPGNTKTAPAAELTSSTVTPRE
jgi:hypothetical protein